ncbi:MAG: hypothetical protein A4E54_00804 [Pelotomaculum sp. PtaB.Bin117]|nr:MAG: hypothetical protein A4E54_00804 [Pelotomaculum sp. PtaB.Bin117]
MTDQTDGRDIPGVLGLLAAHAQVVVGNSEINAGLLRWFRRKVQVGFGSLAAMCLLLFQNAAHEADALPAEDGETHAVLKGDVPQADRAGFRVNHVNGKAAAVDG